MNMHGDALVSLVSILLPLDPDSWRQPSKLSFKVLVLINPLGTDLGTSVKYLTLKSPMNAKSICSEHIQGLTPFEMVECLREFIPEIHALKAGEFHHPRNHTAYING